MRMHVPGAIGSSRMPMKQKWFLSALIRMLCAIPLLWALSIEVSQAQTFTYDNTTAGILTEQGTGACGATTELQRDFSVTGSFTINDLNVGINAGHTWRGNVRVRVVSPSSTNVVIIAQDGPDSNDNYDLMLDDESGGTINSGSDESTLAPIYDADRSAAPSNALSAFDGEQANGTWSLFFCNTDIGGATGARTLTFNSARLVFDGAPPSNEIGGSVFRDYDADGALDAGEPGVPNITVTAYDSAGNTADTTTTDSNGDYTLDGLTDGDDYRIEFTGLPDYLEPGAFGTNSGTTVVFVEGPAIGVDLAVHNPAEHIGDGTADLVTTIAHAGDPTAVGYTETGEPAVVTIDYDVAVASGANTEIGEVQDVGSLWGLAYQRSTNTVYGAASLKRHAGFGPLGEGGIYAIDVDNPNTVIDWIDVDTIGIDTGSVTRNAGASTNLPATASDPNWDVDAYANVGKVSLGDIDFDENDSTLWIINLNDRSLWGIENADPGTTPTSGDVIGPFSVDSSGISCNNGLLRPWGVKSHDGLVYVGAVCTGETSGATQADLSGHVLQFDPDNTGAGFTSVLDIDFNDSAYNHPMTPSETQRAGHIDGDGWQTWFFVDQFVTRDDMSNFLAGANYKGRYAVPILSDIEFDSDGSMIVGIKSRFGSMQGQESYAPDPGLSTDLVDEAVGSGDIVRACLVGGSFVLEGDPSDCPAFASAGDEGPAGTEFYSADNGPGDSAGGNLFREQTTGALALLPGSGEVVSTVYDPSAFFSNGLEWYSNADGTENNRYEIYADSALPLFGKGNGLGDIELLVPPAPLEIGNRMWDDYDGDGIQDPGEPGIGGVEVGLYDDTGTLVETVTTDTDGTFLFSSADQTDATGRNYNVAIDTDTDYTLAILDSEFNGGTLDVYSNTLVTNADGTTNDAVDDNNGSDGVTVSVGSGGNSATFGVSFTTGGAGANNHSFDFGVAQYDLGDAPDTYGTTLSGGARHLISRNSSGVSVLHLGGVPDSEQDGQPGAGANNDAEEDGPSFSSPGGPTVRATVPIVNNTGGTVTVCAWMDIPSGGSVDGSFDASDGQCQSTSLTSTTLTFTWSNLPNDQQYTTYTRFRITSDSLTTSNATGTVSNGEVEDHVVTFDFTPTVATIGQVNLDVLSVKSFVAGLSVNEMETEAISELLNVWDPGAAARAGTDHGALVDGLMGYLDPDGDGQLAVFRWDTLEERGTIGFYVERSDGSGSWTRINNDLLPGMINAPMGAEYQLADPTARSGETYLYRLIEQEATGTTRTYGPYVVEMP